MPRIPRTRISRTIVSFTVLLVAIGAAIQFRHLRHASVLVSTPPPLQMSLANSSAGLPVKPPVPPANEFKPPAVPKAQTLVTQTPDPGHRTNVNTANLLPLNNPLQPNLVKPVSGTMVAPVPSPTAPAQTSASAGSLVTDASAKLSAGDLIAARTLFNQALLSGSLNAADTDSVKKQMAEINQTLIFSPKQFPKDPLGGVYVVRAGDRLSAIGNSHQIPFELLLPLNRMTDGRKLRYGQSLKIINGPFHAVVTKSKFTLDIYLGAPGGANSTYITTFSVGLGTDNSTPTGTWTIHNKVTHPAYFPPKDTRPHAFAR